MVFFLLIGDKIYRSSQVCSQASNIFGSTLFESLKSPRNRNLTLIVPLSTEPGIEIITPQCVSGTKCSRHGKLSDSRSITVERNACLERLHAVSLPSSPFSSTLSLSLRAAADSCQGILSTASGNNSHRRENNRGPFRILFRKVQRSTAIGSCRCHRLADFHLPFFLLGSTQPRNCRLR